MKLTRCLLCDCTLVNRRLCPRCRDTALKLLALAVAVFVLILAVATVGAG